MSSKGSRRKSSYKAHVYATGYLDKKGATALSRSHKRYFVLAGEVMAYFVSKEQFEMRVSQVGAIPLSEATDVWAQGKVINMKTHYRTYVFTAQEEDEAKKWSKALKEAISRFTRQATERPKDKAKIATAAILGDIRVKTRLGEENA